MGELESQLELVRDISNNFDNGVVIIDRELKIVWLNDFLQNKGFNLDNLKGKAFFDVFGHSDFNFDKNSTLDSFKTGKTHKERRKGGDGREYEIESIPISVGDEVKYVVEVSKDISGAEESEEKYKSLIDNAPLSFQSLNEEGYFKYVNLMWLKTLGYKKEEVIGKWFGDFLHPNFKANFEKSFSEFKQRGYVHDVEFKMRHKKGHYLDILFEGHIGYHPDDSFKQTYCVFRDITEQKKVEETLQKSEENLSQAQKIAKIGSWHLDIVNNKLTWSDEIYRMFGLKPQQFKATYESFLERIHPDDRKKVNKAYTDSLKDKKSYDIEHRIVLPNGEQLIVCEKCDTVFDDKGKPLYSTGTVQDITEKKKVEEELLKEKEFSEKLLETAPGFIVSLDPKGTIITFNKSAEKLSGYSKEEVIGKNWFNMFIDPADREKISSVHEDVQKGGSIHFENHIVLKNGEKRMMSWNNSDLKGEDGENVLVIAIGTDITHERAVEQEREKLNLELKRRVEELEKFQKITVGREIKMIELKKRIKELEEKTN